LLLLSFGCSESPFNTAFRGHQKATTPETSTTNNMTARTSATPGASYRGGGGNIRAPRRPLPVSAAFLFLFAALAAVVAAQNGGAPDSAAAPTRRALRHRDEHGGVDNPAAASGATSGDLAETWGWEGLNTWSLAVKSSPAIGTWAAYQAACSAIGGEAATSPSPGIVESSS
jgi:hypothetical protein